MWDQSIAMPHAVMHHDFAVTQEHALIIDHCLEFNGKVGSCQSLFSGLAQGPVILHGSTYSQWMPETAGCPSMTVSFLNYGRPLQSSIGFPARLPAFETEPPCPLCHTIAPRKAQHDYMTFAAGVVQQVMVSEGRLPFKTNYARNARVGVLPKRPSDPTSKGANVRWFELPQPLVFFHTVNAWEEGDIIHLYICFFEQV